jgi:hypothetical protein
MKPINCETCNKLIIAIEGGNCKQCRLAHLRKTLSLTKRSGAPDAVIQFMENNLHSIEVA